MKCINSVTKSELNSLRGRQSKVQGEMFEDMISAACEYYQEKDAAYIEKTPEAFRVTGKKKTAYGLTFEGVFTKKCQPDFKGTLFGGQAICFEAKHTDDEEIKQNRLTDEQMNSLDLHDRLGAKSFFWYQSKWIIFIEFLGRYGKI